MLEILKIAKKEYPKGTLFFSASGLIKNPLRVTGVRLSEIYKNTVVNSEGGIIYDNENKIWAKKC